MIKFSIFKLKGNSNKKQYASVRLPRTLESTFFDGFIALEILVAWIIMAWLFVRIDVVPTHFNAMGEADAWGSHTMLIFMALIDAVVMGLLAYSAYHPKYINSPVKVVTEEQLMLNARMVRIMALIIGLLFILIAIKMGGAIFGMSDHVFAMLMLCCVVALIGVAIGFSIFVHLRRPR